MRGFDEDVRAHLQKEMIRQGIQLITGVTIKHVEKGLDGCRIELSSGKVVTGKGGGVKRTNTTTKPKKVAQGHEDFPVLTSEKELENVKLQNYRNINNSLDFVEFGLDVLKTLKNEIYKEDNPKITQDAKSLKVRGSDHRAKRKPIGSTRDDEKLSHKLNYD